MEFLVWLQNFRTPFLENAALFISLLCDKFLLIAIFCYVFWCGNKNRAYGLAFSFVFSGLLIQGTKIALRIDRPFIRDVRIKPSESAIETATGYSFPSGHTQTATSLLGYAAFSVRKICLKALSFALIALVMLSRMILGVHTPSDVIVSFLVTILVVCCVRFAQKANLGRFVTAVSLSGTTVSGALLIYSLKLVNDGTVTYALAHDSIVICICSLTFFVCWFIEKKFIKFDPAATFSGKQDIISRIVKFVVGMAGLLIVYFVFGLPGTVFFDCIKYTAVFVWICCVYPLIIRKVGKRN